MWGNNSEASSSVNPGLLISVSNEVGGISGKGKELVVFDQDFAMQQIINKLNGQKMEGLIRNCNSSSSMYAGYLDEFW